MIEADWYKADKRKVALVLGAVWRQIVCDQDQDVSFGSLIECLMLVHHVWELDVHQDIDLQLQKNLCLSSIWMKIKGMMVENKDT